MEEFLQHKKALNGAVQVETQAKGLPTGLPTRTPSATTTGTHVAEHPRTPSGDHLWLIGSSWSPLLQMKLWLTVRENLFQELKSLNAWLLQLETTPTAKTHAVELVRTSDSLD